MDKSNGGPAFACAAENGHQPGMSLRDWFAGQALAGYLASYAGCDENPFGHPEVTAENCYILAEAMLSERDKEPE